MELELALRLGTRTECTDGPGGKLQQVVLDRATEKVTHLIVDTAPHLGFAVLVPREMVSSADHEHVRLTCTQAELHRMDPFEDTVFSPPDGQHPALGYGPSDYVYTGGLGTMGGLGMAPMGMGPGPTGMGAAGWQGVPPFIVEEHLPPGGSAIGPDAAVEAADGDLGRADELLTDPVTGVLTHLVVRRGHLFGAHMLVVPASAIIEVADERVRLRFTRAEFEAALGKAAANRALGTSIVALFATRAAAEAALTALFAAGFPAPVISVATPLGQAVRFPGGDQERHDAETRHLTVGGVVGSVHDVVLFGRLLILASVTAGGLAGVLTKLGAPAAEGHHLAQLVSNGQFLVVVHADGEEAGVQSLLERAGGHELRCFRA